VKKALTIALLLLSSVVYSQTILIEDDFSTDGGTFKVSTQNDYSTYVKDGHYTMNITKKGSYWFYH
jgi:hypothetical protein